MTSPRKSPGATPARYAVPVTTTTPDLKRRSGNISAILLLKHMLVPEPECVPESAAHLECHRCLLGSGGRIDRFPTPAF
jgi:hypothetical protein